jgi:hypothetical protein
MKALGHYDPMTGELYGVWLPPQDSYPNPQHWYKPGCDPQQRAYVEKSVMAKGSLPTWDDWLDQPGDGLPYGALLVSIEVDPSLAPDEVFRILRNQTRRSRRPAALDTGLDEVGVKGYPLDDVPPSGGRRATPRRR